MQKNEERRVVHNVFGIFIATEGRKEKKIADIDHKTADPEASVGHPLVVNREIIVNTNVGSIFGVISGEEEEKDEDVRQGRSSEKLSKPFKGEECIQQAGIT